ncbi:hypothetical protein [Alteriqipengyuania lutimaris]|uniref:hypothetical protein n=1 Tax=Alteriqipengyuania lutimaris TaxID=1538146 RepID=UPI0015F16828|nr:hypothetical protein [Alteriqipengyuania lutimaris]MBB3035521.1 MFS family permease [Alteriqipengyuania lutimaris]
MAIAISAGSRRMLATILPPLALGGAVAFAATGWAAANPVLAALLFGWIVADALALGTIAKHEAMRPGPRAMLGAFAAASLVVLVASRGPVRDAILATAAIPLALGLTIIAYIGWSGWRALRVWRRQHSLESALGEMLPRPLVALLFAEARVLHLALLSWGRAPDVPAGTQAFAYHRYLVPMIAALMVLQVIELGAVHLLVMLWSPTLAWTLFALSAWGLLWTIALLKSLRLRPILLTDEGVRVRAGFVIGVLVPYEAIAEARDSFSAEEVKARDTLNAALLSWPNVLLELRAPIRVPGPFGREREVARIAFRVDEAPAFYEGLKIARAASENAASRSLAEGMSLPNSSGE